MITGSLALAAAGAFTGASLYVNTVEQPARLALDDRALIKEWESSDHRGFVALAGLALVSAILGFVAFRELDDFRWLLGAIAIITTWPYIYFTIVPLNNQILGFISAEAGDEARKVIDQWGRLEIGLTGLGALSIAFYVWAAG